MTRSVASSALHELTGITLPAPCARLLVCADCGAVLFQLNGWWTCALGHGKLIPKGHLLAALAGKIHDSELPPGNSEDAYRAAYETRALLFQERHGLRPEALLQTISQAQRARQKAARSAAADQA